MIHRVSRGHREGRAVLVAALALSGCYSFTPQLASAALGAAPVRMYLTASGTVALSHLLGDSATTVDGYVRRSTDSSLMLAVTNVRHGDLDPVPWQGEVVSIPTSAIEHVDVRSFDRPRSAIAAAGIVAVGLLVRALLLGSDNGVNGSAGGLPLGGK